MSRENVEIVERIYRNFGRDWSIQAPEEEVRHLVHPDIEVDHSRRVLNPAVYEGFEGLRRSVDAVREAWAEFHSEPERFVDAGDQVLVIETYGGRGRTSGLELTGRAAAIWTLRHGRVARAEFGVPIEEAFAAVGLREEA